ncbi:MAG: inorganic diphosphatase [Pseudomonadota bacterium]
MIRADTVSLGASPPDDINVIVTSGAGTEPFDARVDELTGALVVRQIFHSAMRTPGNLGIVPHTLGDSGDPLAALVLTSHVLAPGMVIAARPVGVLYVTDEGGDEVTVLAVPAARLSKRYDTIATYTDVPNGQLRQIAHFFCHYRDLEERRPSRAAGWGDVNEARRVVLEAADRIRRPVGLMDP